MKKYLWVLLIVLLHSPFVFPQKKTDANVIGHVVTNGSHIPFATVSIEGTTMGVNTDETGHYQLINLPEGTHTIKAQSVGYKPLAKIVTVKAG